MKQLIRNFFLHNAMQGTTLIECLLYCTLLVLLTTISFSWLSRTQAALQKQTKINNESINDMILRDVIMNVLRQAPSDARKWKKRDSHEIVWSQHDHDVGISYEKGQLIRSEGLFLVAIGQWKTRTKSIISNTLKKFAFSLKTQEKWGEQWIVQAMVHCDANDYRVALKNGVKS